MSFSENLIDIGFNTFENCRSLTNIDLSRCKKLMTINDSCFEWCTNLESVRLPRVIKEIRDNAFKHCRKLMNIGNVPTGLEIEATSFLDSKLENVL